jgi:hypothetical protein
MYDTSYIFVLLLEIPDTNVDGLPFLNFQETWLGVFFKPVGIGSRNKHDHGITGSGGPNKPPRQRQRQTSARGTAAPFANEEYLIILGAI